MWGKIAAGAYVSYVHQMYGERLGACALSLLFENSRATAPAMMMINKERRNENTA
jgi:hypothetical protein